MSSSRVRLHGPPSAARFVEAPAGRALEAVHERLRAEAFAAGRAEGLAAGRAEALAGAAARLDEAALALTEARERLPEEMARDSVALACEIAGQLLRTEVDAGRYDLEGVIRDTLREAEVGRAPCTVHLNPADAESMSQVPFRAGTVIEADVDVARGDVHVSTPQGLMTRDLDQLLASIRKALKEPEE